jgi:hypothetical protein
MGVHTFGATTNSISGQNGMWGSINDQASWGNSFFKNMVRNGWAPVHIDLPNNKKRLVFNRVGLGTPTDTEMQGFKQFMFKSDLCFLYNFDTEVSDRGNNNQKINALELIKKDHGCCVWMRPRAAITIDWFERNKGDDGKLVFEFCGTETTCQLNEKTGEGEHFLSCSPGFPLQ